MSKTGHQTKIKMANGEVHAEENVFQDNSLLPQSEELARLKDVDPTVIDWLKARTEKEQDARIDFNTKRMDEYQLIKLIHKARTGHYNQCTGHNRILPG